MKYFLSLFSCIIFPMLLLAQSSATESIKIDERLYEVYEREYIEQLKLDNPFLVKRLNFYLDNAFQVVEDAPGKKNTYPFIAISDLENINILKIEKELGLTHDYHKPVIYAIQHTNKILVYYAGKEFNRRLNDFLDPK